MTPDAICPPEIGKAVFALTVVEPTSNKAKLRAHQPVGIAVSWAAAGDDGIMPPFEVTITSGYSEDSFVRTVYREELPEVIVFFPIQGGPHIVRVAELYHQRYVGTIRLDIEGDRLEASTI